MNRSDITELHYIAPITNLASILQHGILSHRRAARVQHRSVAMPEIQESRKDRVVPGGRKLHEYVNLYFCARNPMLYRLSSRHRDLCVLSVSLDVLDLSNVIITDANAASAYAAFRPSPDGLVLVNRDVVFAEYWTDPNPIRQMQKKSAKCAEVLVPDIVPPRYLQATYVSCQEAAQAVEETCQGRLQVVVNAHLFFR